jgi:hypothetical protein
MNHRLLFAFTGFLSLAGCDERKEITVSETREKTSRDVDPKLFASSDERFRNAKPSPVLADTPHGWLALPASQFRLLNYRFGDSGQGEVWVTLASGTVLDNVNRWRGQFSVAPLDQAGLEKLRSVPLVGTQGVWVEAEGEYASGMGAPNKPAFGLAGIIADVDGKILTVKMVGPKAEVLAAAPTLEAYAKTLRMAE